MNVKVDEVMKLTSNMLHQFEFFFLLPERDFRPFDARHINWLQFCR